MINSAEEVAPFARIILSNLVSVPVNNTAFDFKYEKAAGNFVKLHVSCSLNFPHGPAVPSLADFSSNQLFQLVNLILDDEHVKDLSEIGEILHFAEGSFRQKTCPEFHAHFGICKFELMKAASFPDFSNSGLLVALKHCFEYVPSKVLCHEPDEEGINDLSSLIRNLDISICEPKVSPDRSNCLNVRERIEDGKSLGICTIRRIWDALYVDFYEEKGIASAIWYPWKTRLYNGCPGSWFQLPCPPNDPTYFYLFGFQDTKAQGIFAVLERRLQRPPTVYDKAALPTAKFLKVDIETGVFTVTAVCPSERFYQEGLDGLLCVEVISAIPLKSATDVGENRVFTSETGRNLMLLKCPAVMRKDLNDVSKEESIYFPRDRDAIENAIKNDTARIRPLPKEDIGPLLFHPFLPIVGFMAPPKGASSEKKPDLCLTVLERIQIFLRTLALGTNAAGCEVVLNLHALRDKDGPTRAFGTSVYSTAKVTSTSIPGELGGRWKNVVAYCWLQPLAYFTSSIVADGIKANVIVDDRLNREQWLDNFKKFGRNYEVL